MRTLISEVPSYMNTSYALNISEKCKKNVKMTAKWTRTRVTGLQAWLGDLARIQRRFFLYFSTCQQVKTP